jgi:hypothetical protein
MMIPIMIPAIGPGFVTSSLQKETTKVKAEISNGMRSAS